MKQLLFILLLLPLFTTAQFIVNPYVFAGGETEYDDDAQAFFDANTGLNSTQKTAVNQLVLDLKAAGIWTKFYAIYPFVGGSESAHKWNLKDPDDDDASFRLTFPNGATHSGDGVDWNGSDEYANTFFSPSTSFVSSTSAHLSYYSTENNGAVASVEIGCYTGSDILRVAIKYNDNNSYTEVCTSGESAGNVVSNTSGFFVVSRTSNTGYTLYQDGSSLSTVTTGVSNVPADNIYLGAINAGGSASTFSSRQCSFASIGDGLTSGEVDDFNTAVQAFQTAIR